MADSQGMTLYTYARDIEPGSSNCVEECATLWPPLLAAEGAEIDKDWRVIDRSDGNKQWAYRGKPLYRYSIDEAPGDTYGEGSRALWSNALIPILTPPGIKIEKTLLGYVAANNERKTLYAPLYEDAADPTAACADGACATDWNPLVAPWAARDLDQWTVIERKDGLRQWAYNNRPLFSYSGDVHPRESNGDGAKFSGNDGVWTAVVLQPRLPYPDWVRVENTDAGQMLANLGGKTIYTYDPSRVPAFLRRGAPDCGLDCLAPEWLPVLASAEQTTSGGNWAINTQADGSRQWAYKGKPVFTNTRDKTQGSFLGYRHGGNRDWNVIMHSEDALVGTLRAP